MREAMRLRASAIFLVLVPSLVSAQGELAEPDASGGASPNLISRS